MFNSGIGFFGQRHIFALMTFTGLTISYMLRVNLSVAIVDMVNRTRTTNQTLSGYLDEPTEEVLFVTIPLKSVSRTSILYFFGKRIHN